MDSILLKCANCEAKLGSVINLWTQIGKKYIMPDVNPEDVRNSLKITTTGAVRPGDPDTLIASCELQEAACEKCCINLGQKCLKSPLYHVLSDGQIIFRTSSLTFKSGSDHRRGAEPKIQRVLKLRGESSAAKPHHEEVKTASTTTTTSIDPPNGASDGQDFHIIQIQADLEAQRQEIQRIGSTGYQVMSSFETAMKHFESEIKRLHHSVDTVRGEGEASRKDLSSLKAEFSQSKRDRSNTANVAAVARLDAQLQSTDRTVTELQQATRAAKSEAASLRDELTHLQQELRQVREENAGLKYDIQEAKEAAKEGIATSKLYAAEVSSLRREIKQLRSELHVASEEMHGPVAETSFFSSHQLDILASNISKIGHRASQIESLQMELELFRTRVQRLEVKASGTPSALRNDGRPSIGGGIASQREQGTQSRYPSSKTTRQKRPSIVGEDPLNVDPTPTKRVAVSSDYPKVTALGYIGEEQPSSPLGLRVNGSHPYSQAKSLSANRARTRQSMTKSKK